MLQDLGPGDVAVFGNVADEDDRDGALLCKAQQAGGDFFNLAYRAGSGFDGVGVHGLHGIHDYKVRADGGGLLQHVFYAGFAVDEAAVGDAAGREPAGTHADLLLAFLARYIKRLERRAAEGNLEAEGGFADTGLSAQQYERPRYDAAAEQAVQLSYAEAEAGLRGIVYIFEPLGFALALGGLGRCPSGALFHGGLHESVPLSAGGAAAQPLRAFVAAAGAVPDSLTLACHPA